MASNISLKTFKANFNGVNEKGELPDRLKILNWGVNKTNQGDITVDETTFSCFASNQAKLGRDTIPIDFNHNSVPGTEAYLAAKGSPNLAGYSVPIVIHGQGLFLEKVETTKSGMELAADYKDLSPAPLVDDKGIVIGLHSVALCPAGSVDGLTLSDSALKALSAELKILSVPDTTLQTDNSKGLPKAYAGTQEKNKLMNDEMFSLIKKHLDMPEHCTYEDVMEKLKATPGKGKRGPLDESPPGSSTKIAQWESDGGNAEKGNAGLAMIAKMEADFKSQLEATLKPLSAELTKVKGEMEDARKAVEKQQRDALISQATKDGKVIPLSAEMIDKTSYELLTNIVSNLKPVVPLTSKVRILSADAKPAKRTLSDAAEAIQRQISTVTNPN